MNPADRTPELAAMILLAGLATTSLAMTAPAQYTIDPQHTYPSFEASHMGHFHVARQIRQNHGHRIQVEALKNN